MEFQVTTGIQGIINKITMPNPKALLDMVGGIFDVGRDVISTIKDGKEKNLDTAEIAINVAAGLITSLVTNFSCLITSFQPPVGYILMGVAAIVVGIIAVYNFSQGNTGMGIAQVINLVSIIFSMFNPTCFTGDTEVYTSDGLVCIEEISVGDEVLAYDYETGETELKEVLNVWVKETDEILHVSTSDGETIDTTTNHPFYVEEKGWVAAGDLEIGDILCTVDGNKIEVTDTELEKLAEPISVYNLEIVDFHTYFVGEYGVLVHNYAYDDYLPLSNNPQKVPAIKGADKAKSRPLNATEKANLFDIIEQLIPASNGDASAKEFLKKMGDHALTREYNGWNSVYLNPGSDNNIMRLLYKAADDGSIDVLIRQFH